MTAELVLRPSVVKHLTLGGLSGVLALGGAWLVQQGDRLGWAALIMFGLGVLVFLAQAAPNVSFLKLTDEGFEMKSLGRRSRWRWEDVSDFRVIKMRNASLVGFDFVTPDGGGKLRALASALSGADAALPDTYGRSAQELADLMTDWQRGVRTFDR